MDAKTFGARISNRRHELNLTQAALAQKIGVTDKAVSKWERGAGLPDIELLEPLAGSLGMSVDELIRGEMVAPKPQAPEPIAQSETTELQAIASVATRSIEYGRNAAELENVRNEPEPKRRGSIPNVRIEIVLPVVATLVLVTGLVFAAQQLGDGRIVASSSADGGSTLVEQPSKASTTGTVSHAVIETSRAAAEKDRAELQLARDQQEWRMANRVWSSDDLQWDAVTVGGVSAIGAELKVSEACQALGNGAFRPDFVSGVQTLRLEDGGETLRIEASGTYANGTAGTCTALVGGDCNNVVVQELSVARS